MGLLAYFIPNIHKRMTNAEQEETKIDPRFSTISFNGSLKSF